MEIPLIGQSRTSAKGLLQHPLPAITNLICSSTGPAGQIVTALNFTKKRHRTILNEQISRIFHSSFETKSLRLRFSLLSEAQTSVIVVATQQTFNVHSFGVLTSYSVISIRSVICLASTQSEGNENRQLLQYLKRKDTPTREMGFVACIDGW